MREIILDTETTGYDPKQGHRIVEIGAVEMVNKRLTGKTLQLYLNPEMEMSAEVIAIHGITNEFVADKPRFAEVADQFIEFIGDAQLVIHNAQFDMKFINAELSALGFPPLPSTRAIDTLEIARRKFPGSPASLDALCKRFNIDNSNRQFHGALLDSQLLAEVYFHLVGDEQASLFGKVEAAARIEENDTGGERRTYAARVFEIPPDELAAHQAFIGGIKNALWKNLDQDKAA